tara:strand:+ start:153 stop:596 length:444 start_codon:yes stop_codon:yes gene_type:complete
MNIIEGNLIELAKDGKFDVIIHGCNCFNVMGAGIAKQIKTSFPEAYQADLETKKGDDKKLGTYTSANVNNLTIVNAYTQYNYGLGQRNVDYNAVRKIFRQIKHNFRDKRIAYPKIGAGLGGGNWKTIKSIIEEELENTNHTLVIYNK